MNTIDAARHSPQMHPQPGFQDLAAQEQPAKQTEVNALQKLRNHFNITSEGRVTLNNGETVPLEFLLHVLLAACIEDGANHLKLVKDLVDKERTLQNVKENKRTEQMDQVLQETATLKTVGKVERITNAGCLVASGIEGIFNGNFTLGIPSTLTGVLLAVDQYFDCAGRKQIGSWLSLGENAIDFAISTLTLGLSFGLSGSKALQIAQSVSQAAFTGVKGTLEHRKNVDQSLLKHIDASCERTERTLSRLMKNIDYYSTGWHEMVSNQSENEERRDGVMMLFLPKRR